MSDLPTRLVATTGGRLRDTYTGAPVMARCDDSDPRIALEIARRYNAHEALVVALRDLLSRAEWDCHEGGDMHRDVAGGSPERDCPGCRARAAVRDATVRP